MVHLIARLTWHDLVGTAVFASIHRFAHPAYTDLIPVYGPISFHTITFSSEFKPWFYRPCLVLG